MYSLTSPSSVLSFTYMNKTRGFWWVDPSHVKKIKSLAKKKKITESQIVRDALDMFFAKISPEK